MTKDVIVYVTGTQLNQQIDADDAIELVTRGTYYKKNNKHYVIYDELIEGISGVVKNTIKFDSNMLLLSRSGALNMTMFFEENKRNMTNYNTPFGNVVIGIAASEINVTEETDEIKAEVDYAIDANYEYLSDCSISLRIESTKKK